MTRNRSAILVVEDDLDLAQLLADELGEAGFEVAQMHSAEAAHSALGHWTPALILCDLRLPDRSGLDLLHTVVGNPDPPAFILITAFGTVPQAVEALKAGADDFLTKPLDLEHLRLRVTRTLEHYRLRREIQDLRSSSQGGHFHDLVGQSRPMRLLYEQIQQLARAGGPVLIEGESGSGKELVARAIHTESPRTEKPFVPVNCASIPAELMESELFGHEAGAFTGAARGRSGLFVEADGGTLFLDEIGEMPSALQATLLRVLQDGSFRPVGADRERTVDVRVLTATNRDLANDVAQGEFREDLFYRLETFSVRIPPLREREDDLELLASRFIAHFARDLGKGEVEMTEEALDCLRRYPFPGNVRELRNALERAVTFAREGRIQARDLPERIRSNAQTGKFEGGSPGTDGAGEDGVLLSLAELERRHIHRVLEHTEGNKRLAARILGVSRRTLYRYLEREDPG